MLVDLIEDWYADKLRRSRSTVTILTARHYIGTLPEAWLAGPAAEVTEQMAQCWFNWQAERGQIWANRVLMFIRNVYNLGVRAHKVASSPFDRIEKFAEKKRNRRLRKIGGVDERRALLLEALRYGHPRKRLLSPMFVALTLFFEQALRRSDVRRLRWENIDLDRATGALLTSKTGARIFPLTWGSRRLLYRWKRQCGDPGEGWVFADPDDPERPLWGYDGLTRAFVRLRKRAGLGASGIHLHDLKHESLSTWAERGMALPDLQSLAGNSYKTLGIYMQSEAERVAGRLHAAAGAPLVEVPPLPGRKGGPK